VPKFEKEFIDFQKELEKLEKLIGNLEPMSKESEFDKLRKLVDTLEKDFKKACKDVDKEMDREDKEAGNR
jgi:hypothetical protein